MKNSTYQIQKKPFGTLPNGREVDQYTLSNNQGMTVQITNYGGIVTSLEVPDREGNTEDVVLGFDTLDQYLEEHPYFGAIVGRCANRISDGSFELGDRKYTLATNEGSDHLHGGEEGFDKKLWNASSGTNDDGAYLKLTYTSPDGEEGYPGKLSVTVTYTVTDNSSLQIDYRATTTKKTIANLTNHSYFNLAGHGSGSILDHRIMIPAERFTPLSDSLLPTGEIRPVEDTPLDFTSSKRIGNEIHSDHQQIKNGNGYDHNYVIKEEKDGNVSLAARAYDPTSGRELTVRTTEPGMQFYTGNLLDGSITGKDGATYDRHAGFCLETQYFPDAPNKPNFPSAVLEPDETYRQTTIYQFDVRE